ncbi:CotH kinase family protein [Aureivirga marina]|uniref:CotH kinase family protein n=1 Tax=Aureivirga marina TaxID=1182451 RepID=UPI0018CA515A|nr:CotH kinase family protein [Aureivirga marina]
MKISIPTKFVNPIVFIVPDKDPISKYKTEVAIYYVDADLENPVSIDEISSKLIKVEGEMHVRGDATANMPKKQFAVKLKKDPKKGNFLGMKNGGKHWVFNDCGEVDFTMLRTIFAFTQQKKMGEYAPEYKFFELFIFPPNAAIEDKISTESLSENYHGLYLNFDKIRFQKSRINLPYSREKITSEYAIIQLNESHEKYLQLTPNPPLTANVEVYEPKFKDIKPEVISEFKNWFYTKDFDGWAGNYTVIYNNLDNFGGKFIPTSIFEDVRKTTDYLSFATYFILNEISKDPDGYHKSTFMVKNNEKCFAGPLWDKNKSYGNTTSCGNYPQGYVKPEGWLYSINGQSPVWWHIIIKDSLFCEYVWNLWIKHCMSDANAPLPEWINTFIDAEVAYLFDTKMFDRNSQKWPNAFNQNKEDYKKQVDEFKTYLVNRFQWISENLAKELYEQSSFIGQYLDVSSVKDK